MAEVQNPPRKAPARRAKALLRKSEKSARTVTEKAPRASRSKGGKQAKRSTGRLRVRKEEAAYRRVDDEQTRQVRADIDAALQAASRIREQIEAKIERGLKEDRGEEPRARSDQARGRFEPARSRSEPPRFVR